MRDPYKLETEIIPGLLEHDWEEIEKKIHLVTPFAPVIHIDVIDGKFADNTTWLDEKPFEKYTKQAVFEVHLMVENPIEYIQPFAKAGFSRFIGHIEHMKSQTDFVAQAQMYGEVALALDTPTPVEKITVDLEDLDFMFVMTVKAGFSHQTFLPEMLEKVKQLREKDVFLPIEIDGGVNDKTIVEAKEAGATRFVTTGFIFNHEHTEEQYKTLLSLGKR
ncbi:MAG TPA: hypothetical protein VFQ63_00420 [Patescibacteria group bacterium]|nr:hypothetical protein [Patescibacteria group bacterium]